MQVPEKLALIGGSILLSSTLIFTLKSQASSIIPNVSHSISGVFDHISDTQKASDFDSNYQQAQKKGWQTGNWGSAKFYVNDQHDMHIGSGELNGSFTQLVNGKQIKTINLDSSVQAPQDSSNLFAYPQLWNGPTALTAINGLSKLDTSQVTNMYNMFATNTNLTSIDLSNFNTSKVTNMQGMFDIDTSLANIDISSFNTSNVTNTSYMFDIDNVKQLTLGKNTKMASFISLYGTYQNGNQVLNTNQLSDGNIHPGTWIKQ